MTNLELIKTLCLLPPELQVRFVYDGEARGEVHHAWKAWNRDCIVLADSDEVVYSNDARPEDISDYYWRTK